MKGTFQKTVAASALACSPCRHFCGTDPDIFYCELQQIEFPALCVQYLQNGDSTDMRLEWFKEMENGL